MDRLTWKFDKKGVFSVKSLSQKVLTLKLQGDEVNSFSFTKALWKGLVPSRVEIFAWFVLIGKINMKDRLLKFGIIQQNQSQCSLCNRYEEDYMHLFFSCEFARYLWCFWLQQWSIHWVFPVDQKSFFESWMGMNLRGVKRKRW